MTSGTTVGTSSANSGNNNGASRLSRISFRPRPIDVSKPMPIIRTLIEDTDASTFLPIMPTGMEAQEEEESHLQEIIQASTRVRHDQLPEIPIPVVKIVDGYDTESNPHPYHHNGQIYIIHKDKADDELDQITEYDMDSEDEDMVNSINQQYRESQQLPPNSKKTLITMDRFESIFDKFEKELHYYGSCDQAKADQICKGLKQNYINMIYQHWVAKRKHWKNSMIRRLIKPPDREDPSPYKAFRPREENANKQKKARKNDSGSLQKMQQLRHEFERARTLLEMMKKREKLKKDQLLVYQELYDKLTELATIRSTEEELPMASSLGGNSNSSGSIHKKKKDLATSSSSVSAGLNSSLSNLPNYLSLHHYNYPGPIFSNNDQQPLILSNGKARQEGYRHFIPKSGQFPTPTIDREYSSFLSSASTSTQSPLSKPVGGYDQINSGTSSSNLSPINLQSQQQQNQQNTDAMAVDDKVQQLPPLQEKQQQPQELEKKEKEEAVINYFDSISIPTSSTYYDDDDYLDSEISDSEQDSSKDILPQPKLNSQGQPIYPSFNKGYIFIGPNLPPILGKVRAGRYGGTYIDFLPYDQTKSFLTYQNHLKLYKEKIKQDQEKQQLELEKENQLKKEKEFQYQSLKLYQNQNNKSSPLNSSPTLSIKSQDNSNIINNNNNNNQNICNNNDFSEIKENKSPPINSGFPVNNNNIKSNNNANGYSTNNNNKRKLNSAYDSLEIIPPSSPTKKLLTDYDGFSPIISSIDSNGSSSSSSNGNSSIVPLTKSLSNHKQQSKSIKSNNNNNKTMGTIDQYFTKKQIPSSII